MTCRMILQLDWLPPKPWNNEKKILANIKKIPILSAARRQPLVCVIRTRKPPNCLGGWKENWAWVEDTFGEDKVTTISFATCRTAYWPTMIFRNSLNRRNIQPSPGQSNWNYRNIRARLSWLNETRSGYFFVIMVFVHYLRFLTKSIDILFYLWYKWIKLCWPEQMFCPALW